MSEHQSEKWIEVWTEVGDVWFWEVWQSVSDDPDQDVVIDGGLARTQEQARSEARARLGELLKAEMDSRFAAFVARAQESLEVAL